MPAGVVVVATLPLIVLNLDRVVRAELRTDPYHRL